MPLAPRHLASPRVIALAFSVAVGLSASVAAADRLALKDGRIVEGAVTKEGESYRVASRFGEAEFAAIDVKEWVKAESIEAQWRRRAAALKADDYVGRAALAKWLTEAGRADEGTALAQSVVAMDPENAVANAVLGYVRHRGTWMSPDAARLADGQVRHGDVWYTPEEWDRLDKDAKQKADEADRATASKQWNVRVNEAVRLMLAPDKVLRAEGEKRLLAVAKETESKPLEALATQVKAYAESTDRLVAAAGASDVIGDHASVLAECRIQLAKLKRPIKSFTTGLASNLAGAGVTIQLPEIEIIKIGTTVSIPVR